MTNIGERIGIVQDSERKCFENLLTTGAVSPAAIGGAGASRLPRSGSGAGSRGKYRATGKTPSVASSGPDSGGFRGAVVHTSEEVRNSAGCCDSHHEQNYNPLIKRCRAKFVSRALAVALAELRGPLEKAYRRSVYCSEAIEQADGVLRTHYCGYRWCLICSRIRTARALDAYGPVVGSWEAPFLVTLTVRNCIGEELPGTMAAMVAAFARCRDSMRKAGVEVRAIRKLECTYNARENTYHPHFHVLIDGRFAADDLRRRWLRQHPDTANDRGQDVRPCDAGGMKEIFKYFTKITAKATTKTGRRVMPLAALDTIFRAMRGRRVWQPVGFRLPKEVIEAIEGEMVEVTGTPAFKREGERVLWAWEPLVADWIDHATGDTLSGYEPGEKFRRFVGSIEADLVPVCSDA